MFGPLSQYYRKSSIPGLHILKNTGYQVIGKVVSGLSVLFVIRFVTQQYHAEGVGQLTLILNYLNIFYLISDFGINAVAVKRMVEVPEEESVIFRALLTLRILASIVLFILAVGLAFLLPYDAASQTGYSNQFKLGVLIVGATIITQAITITTTAVFQKRLLYSRAVFAASVGSIVLLLFYAFFAKSGTSFGTPLFGYTIGGLMTVLLALLLLPAAIQSRLKPLFSWSIMKRLLIASLPIAATQILTVVYFRNDSFILAALKPAEDVGIYGAAYKWFDQGVVFPIFFVNALYPSLLQQFNTNKNRLKHTLWISSVLLFTGGTLLAFILIIAAPYLINFFGNLPQAVLPLRILAAGLPVFFLSNLYLWLMVTLGKQHYLIPIYGFSMLFNIIGNYLLIPMYSYKASAMLTGASETIVLVLTMYFGLYFLRKSFKTDAEVAQTNNI